MKGLPLGLRSTPAHPGRCWFWIGLAAGLPLIAIGVKGIALSSGVSAPRSFVEWLLGGDLVHDLVIAPAVLAVGALLRRVVPARYLGPVQWATALTAIVALFTLIPLFGWGKRPGEPTVQPLNYPLGFGIVAGAVWVSAGVAMLWRRRALPGRRSPGGAQR